MGWHRSLLVAMLEDYWRPCPTGYGSGYGYDSVSLMSFAVSHSITAGHRTGLLSLLGRQKSYPQPFVISKHTFRLSDCLINQINPCREIILEKPKFVIHSRNLKHFTVPESLLQRSDPPFVPVQRQINLFHSLPQ